MTNYVSLLLIWSMYIGEAILIGISINASVILFIALRRGVNNLTPRLFTLFTSITGVLLLDLLFDSEYGFLHQGTGFLSIIILGLRVLCLLGVVCSFTAIHKRVMEMKNYG